VTPGEKKLVIVADDFGLTDGVNRGIYECHQAGIVSSASIMVNTPASRQASAMALQANFDVGIHVNLTLGYSIKPREAVRSLVSSRGLFYSLGGFLGRACSNRLKWSEVESEVRAQIEYVFSLGLRPTHLNSHHHVHILPPLFEILNRLCRDYGIPFLRVPTESLAINPLHFRAAIKKSLITLALSRQNNSGLNRRVDHFYGVSLYNARDSRRALENIVRAIKPGVSELMVHPGYNDPLLEEMDSCTRQREKEVEILTGSEIKKTLRTHEVQLVSFRDLLRHEANSSSR
jgi:predicted glycoside hydrolase/deacetylase ChbG (UPF0249 family)